MVGRGDNQEPCQGGVPASSQSISRSAAASNPSPNTLNQASTSMVGMGCTQGQDSYEKCELCGKTFSSKSYLKHHLKMVHNKAGSGSLECPKCLKEFAYRSNLNRHVKKCSGSAQGYECLQCKKSFHSTTGLKKHCAQFHNDRSKSVRCRICNRQFEDRSQLFTHKKQTHNS